MNKGVNEGVNQRSSFIIEKFIYQRVKSTLIKSMSNITKDMNLRFIDSFCSLSDRFDFFRDQLDLYGSGALSLASFSTENCDKHQSNYFILIFKILILRSLGI